MHPSVLLLTPSLATIGGVETYYRALDLERHDERIRYFFVTTDHVESPWRRLTRVLRNYVHFWRALDHAAVRLVVLNPSFNTNSFYRDAVFCRLALLRRKRVLVFVRGWSTAMERSILSNPFAGCVFRMSFGSVRHFIVLAETFRDKLVTMGCDRRASFWIETTVADEALAADFSIQSRLNHRGPLRVLYLSRLVRSKSPRLALEAFTVAQIENPGMRFELRIAGDGPEAGELSNMITRRNLANVRLVGPVSGASKAALLRQSDILLFPTCHGEGMPNVVLEAMMFGMPVIVRNVGGIGNVVRHGHNGFITSSTDPAEFAGYLAVLAADSELRHRMSLTNFEQARALYATTAVRTRFTRIIDTMLESATTVHDQTTGVEDRA